MATKVTSEQIRAAKAYEFAMEGSQSGKKNSEEYKSYAKKIPMLIKTNGLGATYAFMKSRGGTYQLLYEQTFQWLKENPLFEDFKEGDELVEKIISMDSSKYRAVTVEVLALFSWIRRFAEGLIKN